MYFEWDPLKARLNLNKHAVSFIEASSVFNDLNSISFPDPDHSTDEERWLTIGFSNKGRLLIVSHKDTEELIRIISCRQTTKHEIKLYEK